MQLGSDPFLRNFVRELFMSEKRSELLGSSMPKNKRRKLKSEDVVSGDLSRDYRSHEQQVAGDSNFTSKCLLFLFC